MPCKEEEDDSQISQNLNENLTEHEVVTETVTGFLRPAGSKRAELERPLTASCAPLVLRRASSESGLQGDTMRIERVTDRQRSLVSRLTSGRVCSRSEESKQDSLFSRSTADFHVQDSRVVEEVTPTVSGKLSTVSKILKWVFFILLGLIALIITAKVCLLRR